MDKEYEILIIYEKKSIMLLVFESLLWGLICILKR